MGVLHVELLDRHELDGRHAELPEVGYLLHEPCVGAPPLRAHPGVRVLREPPHVELVDDAGGKVLPERFVPLPVVPARVRHAALGRMGAVVAGPAPRDAVIVPSQHHGPCVGVEEHLVAIVEVAPRRVEGAVHPVSIELARAHAGHEAVPVVEGPVEPGIEVDDTHGPDVVRVVEQEEFHRMAAPREQTEVHPVRIHGRPQGVGPARPDLTGGHRHEPLSHSIKMHGMTPCSMLFPCESRQMRESTILPLDKGDAIHYFLLALFMSECQ
ncbi:MAG: hypothetical protein BWX71_02197 [Deltaproteobacteria bacterium ADurb.Bin072]|nr:MAG: hypothetical protein BWX71_02197 [Deltaproteobacteria bacterium ADurb.Bin072]